MRPLILIFCCLFGVQAVFTQSGRVKPAETPLPRPSPGTGNYVLTDTRPPPTTKPTEVLPDADDLVRVTSALVPIPVSVTDRAGRPVTYLSMKDFRLMIDDQPAEIGDLARSETPIRLALLFDNSSSVIGAREFEKDAAIKFLRRVLRPHKDLAALFSVSTVSRLEQTFTRDFEALTTAIELFPPPEGATALLEGMVSASEYLREVEGRRVIVIVSDGDDTKSDVSFADTVRALQIANCQVYVVKTTDFENFRRTGSRRGNANTRALIAESRMNEITRQTGGAVYSPVDERELEDAFRRISAELSQQYILSYYPEEEPGRRGQFREIKLVVAGRPDLTVRARKGFYAAR